MRDGLEFPLRWPTGRERNRYPEVARFRVSLGSAVEDLHMELERLGADHVVISCNMRRDRRGRLPNSYRERDAPDDAGVAVYCVLDGDPHCFSCDQWDRVEDNVRAIGKTIEAMRGIERWGSSQAMRQAMSGFKALPPSAEDWRSVLQLQGAVKIEDVVARYRQLARGAHPDHGGSPSDMVRLNLALDAARKELS